MARPLPTRGLGSRFRDAYRRIARRRPLCHECGRTIRGRRLRPRCGVCYQCARSGDRVRKGETL